MDAPAEHSHVAATIDCIGSIMPHTCTCNHVWCGGGVRYSHQSVIVWAAGGVVALRGLIA